MIFIINSKWTCLESDSFLSEWTLKYLKLLKNTIYFGKKTIICWKPENLYILGWSLTNLQQKFVFNVGKTIFRYSIKYSSLMSRISIFEDLQKAFSWKLKAYLSLHDNFVSFLDWYWIFLLCNFSWNHCQVKS